jgi:hypothetical protein
LSFAGSLVTSQNDYAINNYKFRDRLLYMVLEIYPIEIVESKPKLLAIIGDEHF